MTRCFVDGRETPSGMGGGLDRRRGPERARGGTAQHATEVHQHEDSPELRDGIRSSMQEGQAN
jgi:hypothetical protein